MSVLKVIRTIVVFAIFALIIPTALILFHYNNETTAKKDCAVVFGAAVWRGSTPSHALYDRTATAAQLYNDGLVNCIVISGGASTYGAHEVVVMQDILFQKGVPTEILIRDRDGINTLATINDLDPQKSYTMVSNDFHLARIALLANRANIADFSLHKATYHSGRYVKEPRFFAREVIAYIYYGLFLHKVF